MERHYVETAVGIFVIIGIAFVGYLTVRLGRMEWLGGDYYPVYARFQSAAGLRAGADVEIAGVLVGRVDSICLDQKREVAVVKMAVKRGVALSDDTIASVSSTGLIGDKYIRLSPGGSEQILKPGGMIINTEPSVSIEDLISRYIFGRT